MKTKVAPLIVGMIIVMMFVTLPGSVLSQKSSTGALSAKNQSYYSAMNDYYNKSYSNTLINPLTNSTLSSANVSEWKIDLSNNGWTFAQSWVESIGNTSSVMVVYSDNGGRNYTQALNVCPGGIDKRTGIYGPEFWVLCVRPTPSGHNNIFWVETRTGRTPYSHLTNLSVNQNQESTILDFAVNGNTGSVVATWFESPTKFSPNTTDPRIDNGTVHTDCYRC
jgi:hypothetical protein